MPRRTPARYVELRLSCCWPVDPSSVPACSEHSRCVIGFTRAQKEGFWGEEESTGPSALEMRWGEGSRAGQLSRAPKMGDGQDAPEGCPGAGFYLEPVFTAATCHPEL